MKYPSFFLQISDVLRSTASIISIVCQHVSQFHGTNVPEVPSFLRVLTTKRTDGLADCNIPPLEQPNIVFGVGAGGWYHLRAFIRATCENSFKNTLIFRFSFILRQISWYASEIVRSVHRQLCTGLEMRGTDTDDSTYRDATWTTRPEMYKDLFQQGKPLYLNLQVIIV